MSVITIEFPAYMPQAMSAGMQCRIPQPQLRYASPTAVLPAATDFSALRGAKLLCLLDDENLHINMEKVHQRNLCYRTLRQRLAAETGSLLAWAVLTSPRADQRRADMLKQAGWRVLSIPQEMVNGFQGPQLKANADHDLAFLAGVLAGSGGFNAVLLGTGDGDLAVALARGFKRLQRPLPIHTLSIPGSASSRLKSRTDLFSSSIAAGADLADSASHRGLALVS